MKNECVLRLEKLFFQNIEFNRLGLKNDNEPEFKFDIQISKNNEEEIYKVAIKLQGEKADEYKIMIEINGLFTFSALADINYELKKKLISNNAVAILIPYLRSEVSLLTAQPETDSVVLPAFNINALMEPK